MKFTSDIVIGIEVHIELATDSKLFCGCVTHTSDAQDMPNTRTCEVCLGHPGSKPVVNKKAIEYAIKFCLAVNSKLAKEMIFSRKSYFYPDMAKNYQISQYEIPLGMGGKVKLDSGKEIGLVRIHLEEDPASLVHPAGMRQSSFVLVDYNRSGDALMEIVTEPDMTSADEARDFMNRLITVLNYLEIFDVDRCIIKADANVSIKESGYVRSEVKNITGFKDIERALNYEIERQKKEVKEGKKLKQETRGWDSATGITFSLRTKETEEDYGYIIDPDLVRIRIEKNWVEDIKLGMPELAEEKTAKFVEKHGVKEDTAKIISKDRKMAEFFEKVAAAVNPDLASKWIRRELTRVLNYNKKTLEKSKISEKHMIDLLKLIDEKKITEKTAQKIIELLVVRPFDVNKYVEEQGLLMISDKGEIEKFCKEAIAENPQAVDEFRAGNEKSFNFLVGQVMRKSKGKASPQEVNSILKNLIK